MVIPGRGAPLHAAGAPPTSGAVTAILTVVIILMALTPVCVYVWKSRGCPRPRLPDRARHRYRRDMRHVHRQSKFERTRKCACCGGVNTRLRRDRAQWVCKNRDLCRKSMVYMNMLESL